MSNADQESWAKVKERLRADVGDDVYSSWFARMDLEAIEEGTVRMSVATRFLKSWIQSHYAERVLACWQAQDGKVDRIELIVRSAVLRNAAPPKIKPELNAAAGGNDSNGRFTNGNGNNRPMSIGEASVHEALGGSPLDPRLTFDGFVVGRSNTLAHAAAKQVAMAKRNDPVMFNPLYIHAGVGLGKTHLLQSITWSGNAAGERKVLYLTAEKFMYGFCARRRRSPSRKRYAASACW
jgi:chromosomal replication initiator protein